MLSKLISINLMFVMALFVVAVPSAYCAPDNGWESVSGGLSSLDEPALIRSDDGILHVFLRKEANSKDTIFYYQLPASTGVLSAPISVLSSWDVLTNPSAIVNTDGTLRVFFGGIQDGLTNGNYNAGKLYSATSNAALTTFLLDAGPLSDNSAVYASDIVGALKSSKGEIYSTWAPGSIFFRSLSTAGDVQGDVTGCCNYFPGLAENIKTGEIISAWYSNIGGSHGVLYQTIFPEKGTLSFAPGSSSKDRNSSLPTSERTAIVGRRGKEGVYLGYCSGYPICREAKLLKIGDKTPKTIIKKKGLGIVSVVPGSGGALWFLATKGKTIFVTRSNKSAKSFPEPALVNLPKEATRAIKIIGEGSRRFLDLFMLADTSSGAKLFHRRVSAPSS